MYAISVACAKLSALKLETFIIMGRITEWFLFSYSVFLLKRKCCMFTAIAVQSFICHNIGNEVNAQIQCIVTKNAVRMVQ
jgi:hypothetical protein